MGIFLTSCKDNCTIQMDYFSIVHKGLGIVVLVFIFSAKTKFIHKENVVLLKEMNIATN